MVQVRVQGLRLQPPQRMRDMHPEGCKELRRLWRPVPNLPLHQTHLLQRQVRLHLQLGMDRLRPQEGERVRG